MTEQISTPRIEITPNEEARWKEIMAQAEKIYRSDDAPTDLESAFCGALNRLKMAQRETVELRQQLAALDSKYRTLVQTYDAVEADWTRAEKQLTALEQKRRRDVRKCEEICTDQGSDLADYNFNIATELCADKIRAAFPDVFKEKNNER